MPATAKPRSVPQRVRDAHSKMKRDAIATWRSWATRLADGGDIPDPIALLSTGTLLGIQTPADSLEADADAIREFRAAEQAADRCRADAADLLAPWADRGKLLAAAEQAEAEGRRLREILARIDDNCNAGHWQLVAGSIRSRHSLVFGDINLLAAQGSLSARGSDD